MSGSVLGHVRSRIGRGLLILLPLLVTVWLLGILFNLIHENVTPAVLAVLRALGVPGLDRLPVRVVVPVIGIVLTAAVVYLIGLLAGNLAGRRILTMIEHGILRIPLVKGIYGSARQLLDAFSVSTGARAFSKVVLLEYPRTGLWTVGFVTRDREYAIRRSREQAERPLVPVFLPTTPNPTSGWMILVPPEELLLLDMGIEEAVKLVVSGGIVGPNDLASRTRPWPIDRGSRESA